MKRAIRLWALTLCLLLSGCGAAPSAPTSSEIPPSPAQDPTAPAQTEPSTPQPDVKGKSCKQPGFAALDICLRRRYVVSKAASDKPLPPH